MARKERNQRLRFSAFRNIFGVIVHSELLIVDSETDPRQTYSQSQMAQQLLQEPEQGQPIKDHHHLPPLLLVLRPPPVFTAFHHHFSTNFQLLKPYESPLPTDLFLSTYAGSVEAVLCSGASPITAGVLRLLPSLRLVVTASAGVNHIDLAECRRRGIAIANAGGVFSEDVADVAVGLLIDVMRRVTAADRFVRGWMWPTHGDYPLGSKLGGKRVGIVGLGSIGSEVAKRLESFGCIISYNSRMTKPSVPYTYYPTVYQLASNCDVLIICCALTDETRHIINKLVMSALGKEGIIINIARGAIINEKELVGCLARGEIAGAGLDVFENEPNVPKELSAMDNVVLLPHRAAFTEEAFFDAFRLVVDNLEAFFSNRPLLSPVIDE
ncbi:glyoxylate/hydroxypyruvate reductase HPR3-like [Rhododendron vialii]|uniref:glyoxylate/hydroxypyruvate reductase HPR3-like n=1 Tax=Rhododendron vialii TaxID=182163 RepID=UPI00265F5EA6|nr:glyoxylate/hydroxypyruvate reductase HPR3-like [Rhododendron vialii]